MKKPVDLGALNAEELGQLFPVVIETYSPKWPGHYAIEKNRILERIDDSDFVRIDHIGSTAVPGMKAKPTIDILLQVSNLAENRKLERVFRTLGYRLTPQPDNPPPHMTFVKGYTPHGFRGQAFHVHVRYEGDWDEIRFRDHLIHHPETARAYENLKIELAIRFRNNREAYTEAKSGFILGVMAISRQPGTILESD
ncbi:MAG: GrpB family protein [Bacteroidales bacterium]